MIWIIVRKDFLLNLVNFRFIAGFILCFILSVLSAWILTQDYAERVDEYSSDVQRHREQLEKAKVYSEVRVTVDKRPEPLGLLCEGVEKYLNGTVTVQHGAVPTASSSAGRGNPFMAGLASMDLSLIVRVVFSLLALLFVYDSISGEREWIFSEDRKDEDSCHVLSAESWTNSYSGKEPDFGHLPLFSEQLPDLRDGLQSGSLDLLLLIFLNVTFFMASYLAFLRYDVR